MDTAASPRRSPARFAIYLPVAFFLLFTLFPIYWLVNSSLKPEAELFSFPPGYWPAEATLENYWQALTETRLGLLYLNSMITAGLTCAGLLVLIIFGGYAMARFRFPGRASVIALFLIAQVLPHIVMIIPVFSIFRAAGLVDTRAALVLTYLAILLPFSVITMRGFFQSIPVELEEAAMVDGCSRLGALFRVVLPAALPGLVATLVYGFINSWNELIFAIILVSSPNVQTLPVGLMSMTDETRTEYGMMLAIAVLALVPSLALFGWVQRYLTTGLSAGAVKG